MKSSQIPTLIDGKNWFNLLDDSVDEAQINELVKTYSPEFQKYFALYSIDGIQKTQKIEVREPKIKKLNYFDLKRSIDLLEPAENQKGIPDIYEDSGFWEEDADSIDLTEKLMQIKSKLRSNTQPNADDDHPRFWTKNPLNLDLSEEGPSQAVHLSNFVHKPWRAFQETQEAIYSSQEAIYSSQEEVEEEELPESPRKKRKISNEIDEDPIQDELTSKDEKIEIPPIPGTLWDPVFVRSIIQEVFHPRKRKLPGIMPVSMDWNSIDEIDPEDPGIPSPKIARIESMPHKPPEKPNIPKFVIKVPKKKPRKTKPRKKKVPVNGSMRLVIKIDVKNQ
jgi:hypothetical protein